MSVQPIASNVEPRRTPGNPRSFAPGPVLTVCLLLCAAAGLWLTLARERNRAALIIPTTTTGVFPRDGQYHTIGRFAPAPNARAWGSHVGADRNRGTLTIGPFASPRRLVVGVAGYPDNEGNGLFLERVSSGKRARLPVGNVGEAWRWFEYEPPEGWLGKPVRLIAVDAASAHGGWLGVTEPLRGWGSGGTFRREILRGWVANVLLIAALTLLAGRVLARQTRWPALQFTPAATLALFLVFAAPWAAFQHVQEPHFTTMLAGVVGVGAAGVLLLSQLTASPKPVRVRMHDVAADIRAWWREPTLNAWVVAAIALVLFLRKPHTLHTPQLYAEDGSIFLAFTDAFGLRALLESYMGYLHLIPMLTAWSAARLVDVAWWPEFYNGVAFAIWVAVIARTFSRRFPLPGKPWLALAFIVGPQTGEVLFTITNAQWITAFVFIQHVLFTPPESTRQRVSDIAILAVAGLSGPFSIAFAPLVVWHAWRNRNGYTLASLVVVIATAAVQAWTILHSHQPFDYQASAFRLWPIIEITARRLVVWPVAGSTAAGELPKLVVSLAGLVVIGGLIGWMLRPHPQRELRARIVAAFCLILAVGIYRIRPDVWAADNLEYGDRYFYIPRVLVAWMLILQFHTTPRAVAWAARGLWFAMAVVHLPNYVIPAPSNYYWKHHCDPIRRGEPANIYTLPGNWWIEYTGRPKR